MSVAVPPFPGADFTCAGCDYSYAGVSVPDATGLIAMVPERLRAALGSVADVRARPAPDVWSALEYVCHLRDVHMQAVIRLHRIRTEDEPVFEPMLNDLRVRRFRYNALDPDAVLTELAHATTGLLEEIGRVRDWQRAGTRLPGERRTASWLVRHVAHEGVHHVRDIEASAR